MVHTYARRRTKVLCALAFDINHKAFVGEDLHAKHLLLRVSLNVSEVNPPPRMAELKKNGVLVHFFLYPPTVLHQRYTW